MYWLICIIRVAALQTVRERLNDIGCLGMTVSEAEGFGRQRGHRNLPFARLVFARRYFIT